MMQWAVLEFTHYTGDDAMFDNFDEEDWQKFSASDLSEALSIIKRANRIDKLARLDDSDSPYGGVFTRTEVVDTYYDLDDFDMSNTPCWCLLAENATGLNFDLIPSRE